MQNPEKRGRLSKQELEAAIAQENVELVKYYHWMEEHLPLQFFQEIDHEDLMLTVRHLCMFHLHEYFAHIHFKNHAIILSLNEPDADLKVLQLFNLHGINTYQTYISDAPPPFGHVKLFLRITIVYFTEFAESEMQEPLTDLIKETLYTRVKEAHQELDYNTFAALVDSINPRFLHSLTQAQQEKALSLFLRAQIRDHCQYEVERLEHAGDSSQISLRILFAWKNSPKYRFLYRLAKMVYRHGLCMKKMNATYVTPYGKKPILLMSLGLGSMNGKPVWEACDLEDLLQELVTLKYFDDLDLIESIFIDTKILTGNQGNLLRCMISFIHQGLIHGDTHLYSLGNIEEAFCRHPELTNEVLHLFKLRFHPSAHDQEKFHATKQRLIALIQELDTGNENHDIRRKNIFKQAINFIEYCLKTNYYRHNKSAFSFRLDPHYLTYLPYDIKEKFPEIPYGIFYIQGMHFMSFHIRFKDLARGGLRSVIPKKLEQMHVERNQVFAECYNLAYTQQKKNKDIPEGGAKGVILLEPFERLHFESDIYLRELQDAGIEDPQEIQKKLVHYQKEQRVEYLFQAQRAFIHSLITLTNYSEEGVLRAKNIVDYYQKPEYIYLGPDENMYNEMIEWIANYSLTCHYPLGKAFISSKPSCGINHKEYGVTSLGVNVYMQEALKYLDIDPAVDTFTIKMTGGPDGDVAGNQIFNLYQHFRTTAKLLALIDGSGTIYEPEGLDLEILAHLFKEGKPIAEYPPKKLSPGGFLLDLSKKKEEGLYAQKTLCWKNTEGTLQEEWVSGNEMNHLLRYTVHQTVADIFIPAGGRPRTLHQGNYQEFLDPTGVPTAKAIVEGANLYLTQEARRELEKRGVLIIKDSSANKGGVICSSLEVLLGLTVPEETFLEKKPQIMKEILHIIRQKAHDEAVLLLKTHAETGAYLTDLSDKISEKINTFTYELLSYFENKKLSHDTHDPLTQCLMNYCPPFVTKNYQDAILTKIPDIHQKAIIACYIAARLVYTKGLEWSPSIVDILPLVAQDVNILHPEIDDDLGY